MPQSLVKILVHVVFSTKHRAKLITPDIEAKLYAYISGILANHGAKLIAANGTMDHCHFLISLGRIDVGELIGNMKRSSSLWIKQQGVEFTNFYWQKGYGAFSIGQSQVDDVCRYIANQKKHHAKQSFQDEFRELCRKYGVEFDESYCWD